MAKSELQALTRVVLRSAGWDCIAPLGVSAPACLGKAVAGRGTRLTMPASQSSSASANFARTVLTVVGLVPTILATSRSDALGRDRRTSSVRRLTSPEYTGRIRHTRP